MSSILTWKWRAGLLAAALALLPSASVAFAQPIRDEARLFRRRPARHVAMADQVVGQAGEGFRRPHRGQAFPGLADGPDAAALRLRAHRPGRRLLVPARRDAGPLPADRDRRSCPIWSAAPRSAPRCSTIPNCARNISTPSTSGVKVLLLLTHQPGNVHTTKKPIRTTDDMKGMRLRFASPTIREFVAALGGTPVGVLRDRAGRAAAEGHDRRHVHRLRRRRHRLQDGRHR